MKLPGDMVGRGGVIYLPPVVTGISPLTVPYQKGMSITVLGTHFGSKKLFDQVCFTSVFDYSSSDRCEKT